MRFTSIFTFFLLMNFNTASAQEKLYIWNEIDPSWKNSALIFWEEAKGFGKVVPGEMMTSIKDNHQMTGKQLELSLKTAIQGSRIPMDPVFSTNPGMIVPSGGDLFLDLRCSLVEVTKNYPYFRNRKIGIEPVVRYVVTLYGPDGLRLFEKVYLDSIDYKNVLKPQLRGLSEHRRDVEIIRRSYLESFSGEMPGIILKEVQEYIELKNTKALAANPEEFKEWIRLLFEERKLKYPADYDQVQFYQTSVSDYAQRDENPPTGNTEVNNRWTDELNKLVRESRYFALVIGINEYSDPNINDLSEPLKDAENLVSTLTSGYTFEEELIRVLENPTRDEIIGSLDRLAYELREDDNLLIFYAGHGLWDEQLKKGFWIPSDASTDNRANWFSNADLRDYIGGIRAKHTLLISDACFSGGIFKTREAFSNVSLATLELYKLESRKAMTSGAMTTVPDKSVFIEYLIKRLEENTIPFLSAEQLFASFKIAVINNSPTKQVPQFGEIRETGDEGGDFLFIRRTN